TSESHAAGDDLTLLIDWLMPEPGWVALDIATGGGHVAKNLAPRVKQVIATVLTREMLEAAAGEIKRVGQNNVLFLG
ncbi:hypothetical protein MXD81_27395, partial [Microbacteriaceae bacterium K1510]|nr:hypothetical protein [Microbacteriaceae bacterium K1510]